MIGRERLVNALIRLYPAAWRRQYGDELRDLLLARPLTPRAALDVFAAAVQERLRRLEPSITLGVLTLALIAFAIVRNIIDAPPYGDEAMVLLQNPMASKLLLMVLAAAGCQTVLRADAPLMQSGMAAVRVLLIAAVPMCVLGVLIAFGDVSVRAVGPGDLMPSGIEHHAVYTYYSAAHYTPGAVRLALTPLAGLPESWVWGALGGLLGRGLKYSRLHHTGGAHDGCALT